MPDDDLTISPRRIRPRRRAAEMVKRPGMYFGKSSYAAAVAFIETYTIAVQDVRDALTGYPARPWNSGVQEGFTRGLEAEGRLRWGDWRYSIVAEVLDWTGDQKPSFDLMDEEQEKEAIRRLEPLIQAMYALPGQVAEEAMVRRSEKDL